MSIFREQPYTRNIAGYHEGKGSRAPKTGDSLMGYSFWLMLAAAGLAVSGMAAKGRRKEQE